MQSEGFPDLEQRERIAITTALGETKVPQALSFFGSVFEQKASIFSRGKNNELKLMAITGLTAMRSVEAFKLLAREVQNRNNSKDVLEAAHKAALRVKADLQSGTPATEETDG
jgi:hypothetical protein